MESLTKIPGIQKVKATFVLSSSKLETRIPVAAAGSDRP